MFSRHFCSRTVAQLKYCELKVLWRPLGFSFKGFGFRVLVQEDFGRTREGIRFRWMSDECKSSV